MTAGGLSVANGAACPGAAGCDGEDFCSDGEGAGTCARALLTEPAAINKTAVAKFRSICIPLIICGSFADHLRRSGARPTGIITYGAASGGRVTALTCEARSLYLDVHARLAYRRRNCVGSEVPKLVDRLTNTLLEFLH